MKKKLLLIDDEELFVVMLQAFLEEKGYRVDVSDSGERGLEAMRRTHYDLMMPDLTLPHEDGMCLLCQLCN